MKNNEILWEQSLDASLPSLFMGMEITFVLFMISFTLYNMYKWYKSGISLDHTFFVELAEIVLYGGIFLYAKINQLFATTTLQYQVKKDALVYKWGIRKGTSIEIPFKDITAINLVEYNSKDHATIYLVTKEDYKIEKVNFDNNSPRHTYTLERVKKGKEVYQLLMKQWEKARA